MSWAESECHGELIADKTYDHFFLNITEQCEQLPYVAVFPCCILDLTERLDTLSMHTTEIDYPV